MGAWQHPKHYTDAAKAYHVETRKAQIAIFVERSLPALKEASRKLGYALAVHGSLVRDLDLIAVPWTDEAAPIDDLIEALAMATKAETGWGHLTNSGERTPKPHGRIAVTILASAEVHLDVSILPRKRIS